MGTIKSGGSGDVAKVDITNRLFTRSVSRTESLDAGLNKTGFFISTPKITLTTDAESVIWLYRNDEDKDLVLNYTIISASTATGATDNVYESARFAGSGLAMANGSGVEVPVVSTILGVQKSLANTSEIGQTGASITGAADSTSLFIETGRPYRDPTTVILQKGISIGGSITPPTGNTSMVIVVLMEVYLREGG